MNNKDLKLWIIASCICVAVMVLCVYMVNGMINANKRLNEMNDKIDALADHAETLDVIMVDFNDNLNEIRDNQDDIRQRQEEQYEEIDKTFNKIWNSIHKHKEELEEEIKRVEESKALQKRQQTTYVSTASYESGYDHDFKSQGTVSDGEYNYTWYSQRVLPGGGLDIPGRHVDDDGFIRDEDGNLCIASKNLEKGSEVDTPYGKGIVYDVCPNDNLDIYTDW